MLLPALRSPGPILREVCLNDRGAEHTDQSVYSKHMFPCVISEFGDAGMVLRMRRELDVKQEERFMKLSSHAILAAAAIAVAVPSAAVAQDTMNSTDTVTTVPMSDDDDEDFPWGLLGLLGLAGLLGRKRDNDVRPNRTDNVNR